MKKRAVILFLISLFVQPLAAEKAETLSFDSYMEHITANAPELAVQLYEIDLRKSDVKAGRAAGDITLSGSGSYYRQDATNASQAAGVDHTTGITASAGASKKFLSTGTTVGGSLGYDRSVSSGDAGATSYQPSVTATVSQPILYNFLGIVDRYAKENAEFQLDIQRLQTKSSNASTVNYYKALYSDWVAYSQILTKNKKNIQNARTLYNQTLRKQKRGLAENDDVKKALSSLITYQKQYEQNLINFNAVDIEIKNSAGNENILPENSAFTNAYKESSAFEFEYFPYSMSGSSKTMELTLQSLRLAFDVSENKLLPNFDLNASLTKHGEDEEFGGSTAYDKTDYSLGFEVSYPLGNNAAKAENESAKTSLKQMEAEIRSTKLNYNNQMSYIVDKAARTKEIISLQTQNLQALKSQLITEKKKYGQARIDLSYIISTENSIASEEVELIQSKQTLIGLYYDYDSLIK